jgi:prepilin-type N-terminal cleavage/methylation domain-containing protein
MNFKSEAKNKGFTLIELLVVVAIIGLLASIIMANLNTARYKAQVAAVKEEFTQIDEQANIARDTKNQVLGLVTNNYCTYCSFNNSSKANTQSSALTVNAASWSKLGYSSPPIDSWGTPYSLDENELEYDSPIGTTGGTLDCRNDLAFSAGPDGIFYTSDDLYYSIMHFICPN